MRHPDDGAASRRPPGSPDGLAITAFVLEVLARGAASVVSDTSSGEPAG